MTKESRRALAGLGNKIVGRNFSVCHFTNPDYNGRSRDTLAETPFADAARAATADDFGHLGVIDSECGHIFSKGHIPILGSIWAIVKDEMGRARRDNRDYDPHAMGNGLRAARIKARMTLDQAANALGLSKSGYTKKERSERSLTSDFIRRACEVFGVSPQEIIGEDAGAPFGLDIDPNKLATLVMLARERLGSLPEIEAKNLILALISAARKPQGPTDGP